MRQPTDQKQAFAWWRSALAAVAAGSRVPPVQEDEPQCGFYKNRLERNGAYQAISIKLHQVIDEAGELVGDEVLQAYCNGEPIALSRVWPWCASRPVSYETYMAHRRDGRWPGEVDRAGAKNIKAKVDVSKQEPLFR